MDYSNYSDIELITLLKEDKPSANEAFNMIYFKYSSQVYGYCIYRAETKDEADELMQDTWLKFYKSIKSGKSTNNILPLLFTIAKNLAINLYRHKNTLKEKHIQYYDGELIDQFANPYTFQTNIEKDEMYNMLQIAINSLDDKYKEVILFYWFGEMKLKEIAHISNENEATIRKRFERAMKKIDNILKPYLIQ